MTNTDNLKTDYTRIAELCVLMEGLCRVLETREDPTAFHLLEKYRREFNDRFAPVPEPAPCEPEPAAGEAESVAVGTLFKASAPAQPSVSSSPEEAAPAAVGTLFKASAPAQPSVSPSPEEAAPAPQESHPVSELRVDEMLSRREARELRNAFTLNDKFRFRRELFGNDNDAFREALRMIEAMSGYDEALTYMRDDLGWDMDSEAAKDFAVIVSNHFSAI